MAEFCKQCSATFLDMDCSDFEGMCDEGFTIIVLCEGCGPAQVDSNGVCVSPDCSEQHGFNKHDDPLYQALFAVVYRQSHLVKRLEACEEVARVIYKYLKPWDKETEKDYVKRIGELGIGYSFKA